MSRGLFDRSTGPEAYPLAEAEPLRLWSAWAADHERLMRDLVRTLPWEDHVLRTPGGVVPAPRRECWLSDHPRAYTYSGETYRSHPLPPEVAGLLAAVEAETGASFNAVFANLYRTGQDSIGYHADDEASLGPPAEVVIASLSLGARRPFEVRHRDGGGKLTIALGLGDLLLMGRGVQSAYLHRVPKLPYGVGPRVNLTFRRIT